MLTKEAIEQLQLSHQVPEARNLNGVDYLIIPKDMNVTKQNPSTPAELVVNTLGGLIEYLKNANPAAELWPEGPKDNKYLIHIEDYCTVRVTSPLEPTHMVRRYFIKAVARPNKFHLENYMTTERFIIALMSSFAATEKRDILLRFISNIKAGHTREEEDRGASQTVTVRKSVATLGLEEVPNPVELQPYVTFPEIAQPLRSYVFRTKQQKPDEPITCGLFPIESSIWEAETCEKIRCFFEEVGNKVDIKSTVIS